MNSRILYTAFLLSSHTVKAPPPSSYAHLITVEPQSQPVTVQVSIDPTVNMQPNNLFQPGNTIYTQQQSHGGIAQSTSTATNITKNKIWSYLENRWTHLQSKLSTFSAHDAGTSALHWCAIHKKPLFFCSCGLGYFLTVAALIHGNIFMRRRNTWASWKKQCSLEELMTLTHEQLGKELMHAIEQQHMNIANPTDHITPLIRFIREIDQEIKLLTRYIMLATSIRRCKLLWMVPTNNQKIEHAQALKQRLAFIRHTFISWTAADNLANFHH